MLSKFLQRLIKQKLFLSAVGYQSWAITGRTSIYGVCLAQQGEKALRCSLTSVKLDIWAISNTKAKRLYVYHTPHKESERKYHHIYFDSNTESKTTTATF